MSHTEGNTTGNEVITRYDKAILSIAKKVAGSHLDIIDDLCQIGRLTLLKLYPQNSRWAFLSRAIKNRMLTYRVENTSAVRVPEVSQRLGCKIQVCELSADLINTLPNVAAPNINTMPDVLDLLDTIEARINQLPKKQRELAQRQIERLSAGGRGCKQGRALLSELVNDLHDQYQDCI